MAGTIDFGSGSAKVQSPESKTQKKVTVHLSVLFCFPKSNLI